MVPPGERPQVCDLGCGSGLSTALLARRWPGAKITGVDNSANMLDRARERVPGAELVLADIAEFEPTGAQDLIFANASLHWLDQHEALFARLLSALNPGGVLAVQMPDNWDEPSHRLMREIAAREPFAAFFTGAPGKRGALLSTGEYYDCLAGAGAAVTVWTTRYLHALEGADAIADWFSSTGLKPWLDALPDDLRAQYLDSYRAALRHHYPSRADGRVLLAMPRLFIVAQREK